MVPDMEQRIYRLARAGGIDTNPTLFMQRAGSFTSVATEYGGATLLIRRSLSDMNGYLVLTGKGALACRVEANSPWQKR